MPGRKDGQGKLFMHGGESYGQPKKKISCRKEYRIYKTDRGGALGACSALGTPKEGISRGMFFVRLVQSLGALRCRGPVGNSRGGKKGIVSVAYGARERVYSEPESDNSRGHRTSLKMGGRFS